jgi:ABC-type sugar transport system ATPase subunit
VGGAVVSVTRTGQQGVRDLKVAAQQQIEIAKALTLNARLLVFDEPTAALGAEETERLFEQIGRLKSEGVSFIYISHRLDEIARIADRVVVLRDGQLVATHDTAQVPVKTLVEEMVGRPLDRMFPEMPAPAPSTPMIEVEGLTSSEGAFADISFSVLPGEVFGVAGIVGAGRTELVRAISGADPISAGRVKVHGATSSSFQDRATLPITGLFSFPRTARRRVSSSHKRSPKTSRSGTIPASPRPGGSLQLAPLTSRPKASLDS